MILDAQQFSNAARGLSLLFRERGVEVPVGSALRGLLDEVEKFVEGSQDLTPSETHSETDDRVVGLGRPLLQASQLWEALRALDDICSPKLAGKMRTLASFSARSTAHLAQFDDAIYEFLCAAEIAAAGRRVSFLDQRQGSRFRQRVEFLISHRWPVECKRPRSTDKLLRNIRAAVDKICERETPGLIFIALDWILAGESPYRETAGEDALIQEVAQEWKELWKSQKPRVLAALAGSRVSGVVFHASVLAYYHDEGMIGLPRLRLGLLPDGTEIHNQVIENLLKRLTSRLPLAMNAQRE